MKGPDTQSDTVWHGVNMNTHITKNNTDIT